MKKINIEQTFDHPLDVLLSARQERYKHLDKFPELKNVQIVSETTEGHILKQVRNISLADAMPAVLQTVLPSGANMLVEESEFDDTTNTHTFKVTPGGGLDNIFMVKGVSRYFASGDSKSTRTYDIEVTSKVLFVGGVVETAIGDVYRHNLEKDKSSIEHFIQMLKEGKT
jgi:hypothetical protein